MSEELRPCPFCGSEDVVRLSHNDRADIERCRNCNLSIIVPLGITMWNTRPIEDALNARIAELEGEVTELKPYRDGYDAYEYFPEEGENVIAKHGSWLFLAQRRGDKWYDSLGKQAEIRGGVERWWELPEVQE